MFLIQSSFNSKKSAQLAIKAKNKPKIKELKKLTVIINFKGSHIMLYTSANSCKKYILSTKKTQTNKKFATSINLMKKLNELIIIF